MTRKPPSGARHGACLTHVAHDYVKSGWLCISTLTENVAWPFSNYVESAATDDAPAVVRIPRAMQHVDRAADMLAFADHLATVAMAHRSRELERLALPAMTAADYAEPLRIDPDGRPIVRTIPTQHYAGTGHLPCDTFADRESRATLAAAFAARRTGIAAPDTYVAAVAAAERSATFETATKIGRRVASARKARKVEPAAVLPDPEPIQAPDVPTVAPHWCPDYDYTADPPCPHLAPVSEPVQEPAVAPEPATEPEPVSIAPVLAALPTLPDGRPTCERCGQVFRKHGTGAEWHRLNRPECASTATRPSIAS